MPAPAVRALPRRARRRCAWRLGAAALMVAAGLAASLAASCSPRAPQQNPANAPQEATVALPTDPSLPRSSDGRHYPLLPADPADLAALLTSVEEALRNPATPAAELPALGHQQQVIYRVLAYRRAQADAVRAALGARWQWVLDRHLEARRAFLAMHRGERLLAHYRKAAAASGIPWQVLAAVNLVESGMGRIDGVSVADAHGPMQFLPSTWAEPGIGQGDIRDPHDAIQAAARYLVRRGGLQDIRKGLWGYNNSHHYGRAVLAYAALLEQDPHAYTGLYHWEIHFASAAGDLWLPVGYAQAKPITTADYLARMPASRPPAGSSGY
jgi:membrane-bound lytic murein transglycosylase B